MFPFIYLFIPFGEGERDRERERDRDFLFSNLKKQKESATQNFQMFDRSQSKKRERKTQQSREKPVAVCNDMTK